SQEIVGHEVQLYPGPPPSSPPQSSLWKCPPWIRWKSNPAPKPPLLFPSGNPLAPAWASLSSRPTP
ncbi:hypothetical protein M9458_030189, partial [Cirrhinus mrigala]